MSNYSWPILSHKLSTLAKTVVRITIQEAEAEVYCRQRAFYRKEEKDSDTTAVGGQVR